MREYERRQHEELAGLRERYQKAVQDGAFDYAQFLLLGEGLKERLTPEEIADFARKYFEHHFSEYERLRDPQEFQKYRDSFENIPPSQGPLLERHLMNASSVEHWFARSLGPQEAEELHRLSGRAAKPLFELWMHQKKFFDILNMPQTNILLEELNPEERRGIATEGLKQAFSTLPGVRSGKKLHPRTRAVFTEWALRYDVEDESILDRLTEPEEKK